jgi:hypothetical protein
MQVKARSLNQKQVEANYHFEAHADTINRYAVANKEQAMFSLRFKRLALPGR